MGHQIGHRGHGPNNPLTGAMPSIESLFDEGATTNSVFGSDGGPDSFFDVFTQPPGPPSGPDSFFDFMRNSVSPPPGPDSFFDFMRNYVSPGIPPAPPGGGGAGPGPGGAPGGGGPGPGPGGGQPPRPPRPPQPPRMPKTLLVFDPNKPIQVGENSWGNMGGSDADSVF